MPATTSSKTLCFLALFSWNLMTAIDSTALSVALPTIAEELSAGSTAVYWAGTSFVLSSAILQPLYASLAFASERWTVITALSLFMIGSLVAALARNVTTLIAGRCVQGIGGGGLMVTTWVVLARLFDLEQRSRYYSFLGLIWMAGTIIGPLLGGAFALASWRWIFWVNLPLAGVTAILVMFFLKLEQIEGSSARKRLLSIDWLGNIVFAASITIVLVAISWGGVLYPWSNAGTIAPLVLGVLGLVIWAVYSYKFSKQPIIPWVVFADRTAAIGFLGTFIMGVVQFSLLYYLPVYYEGVKGYSSIIAGVALLPQLLGSGPMTTLAALLIAKSHLTRPFNLLGWLLLAYGAMELTLLDETTSIYSWIVLNIPSGVGFGILFSSLTISTQASAENRADCTAEERQRVKAIAASLTPFFRVLGQACGIVIGQAAFTNEVAKQMGTEAAKDAAAMIKQVKILPTDAPARREATRTFVAALRTIWWTVLGVAALMVVLTCFTRDYSLAVQGDESQQRVEDREKNVGREEA